LLLQDCRFWKGKTVSGSVIKSSALESVVYDPSEVDVVHHI